MHPFCISFSLQSRSRLILLLIAFVASPFTLGAQDSFFSIAIGGNLNTSTYTFGTEKIETTQTLEVGNTLSGWDISFSYRSEMLPFYYSLEMAIGGIGTEIISPATPTPNYLGQIFVYNAEPFAYGGFKFSDLYRLYGGLGLMIQFQDSNGLKIQEPAFDFVSVGYALGFGIDLDYAYHFDLIFKNGLIDNQASTKYLEDTYDVTFVSRRVILQIGFFVFR